MVVLHHPTHFFKRWQKYRKEYWNLSSFLVPSLAMLWPDYEYFLSMFGIYYSQISSDELPMCHQTLAETDKVCMQSTMKAYRWEVWTSCWIKLTIQSLTEWEQFQEEEMRIEASSGQNGRNGEALWWLKSGTEDNARIEKKTLAYKGDVPKYEWTLCDIVIFWSFLEMHMKINTKIKCVHVFL